MLADKISITPQSGRLDPKIHYPSTLKLKLVCFIAKNLPLWRDDTDRPQVDGETKLTEYLCDYLNDAAYNSDDWSHIKFQIEASDEVCANRRIDLVPKPRGTIVIANQPYCRYAMLFPIECKRLPTPKENNRDEREYVITKNKTTGGIQRFKFGYHGSVHKFAAMIAYVQDQTCSHWLSQVNSWIQDLAAGPDLLWTESDILQLLNDNLETGVGIFKSEHQRTGGLEKCDLLHLWIEMRKSSRP